MQIAIIMINPTIEMNMRHVSPGAESIENVSNRHPLYGLFSAGVADLK